MSFSSASNTIHFHHGANSCNHAAPALRPHSNFARCHGLRTPHSTRTGSARAQAELSVAQDHPRCWQHHVACQTALDKGYTTLQGVDIQPGHEDSKP